MIAKLLAKLFPLAPTGLQEKRAAWSGVQEAFRLTQPGKPQKRQHKTVLKWKREKVA